MHSETSRQNTHSSEFMLKEYERLHGLVLDEIRQSEQRVSFFVAISSAVGGAMILFLQTQSLPLITRLAGIEVVLVILLIYGLITLSRLSDRNVQLRFLWRLQNSIQHYFAKNDPEISEYLKLKEELSAPYIPNSKIEKLFFAYMRGSIHTLVTFTNSVICGGIIFTALIMFNATYSVTVFITIIVVTISAFLFRGYHYKMRSLFRPTMR